MGGTLGAVLAYFSYRQYYPSLASKDSHRPYSPRIKREDTEILPTHNLHTFGESLDDGNHGNYNDHNDALAGTVPRPDNGRLENVWREGEDECYRWSWCEAAVKRQSSTVSISNDAPYILY